MAELRRNENGWIIVRNPRPIQTENAGPAEIYECWTGDNWTEQTNFAKRFESEQDARSFLTQNHIQLHEVTADVH